MSVIDCEYLGADKVVFPPEPALLIIRKAQLRLKSLRARHSTSSLETHGAPSPKVRSIGESSEKCGCNTWSTTASSTRHKTTIRKTCRIPYRPKWEARLNARNCG